MPERIDVAVAVRGQAERLRKMASAQAELSPELMLIARELDDQARKLEAAAIRDFGSAR